MDVLDSFLMAINWYQFKKSIQKGEGSKTFFNRKL